MSLFPAGKSGSDKCPSRSAIHYESEGAMFQLLEIPVELMENPVPSCGHYSGLAALPAGLPSAQAPLVRMEKSMFLIL